MNNEKEKSSWIKEPYVWLLIAFPLAAVIGGIITTYLAVDSSDGLVVDDYYRKGLEINRVLQRDRIADTFSLDAKIQVNTEDRKLLVTLLANEDFVYPENISIQFLHSTRSGFDEIVKAQTSNNKIYQAQLPQLVKGKWHLLIEADDWRLLDTIIIQ